MNIALDILEIAGEILRFTDAVQKRLHRNVNKSLIRRFHAIVRDAAKALENDDSQYDGALGNTCAALEAALRTKSTADLETALKYAELLATEASTDYKMEKPSEELLDKLHTIQEELEAEDTKEAPEEVPDP